MHGQSVSVSAQPGVFGAGRCRRPHGRGRQEGLATVEFALLLPLLMGLLLGTVEFGLALHNKSVLTQACREGARAGIVLREFKRSEAEIQDIVRQHADKPLVSLLPTSPVQVTVQQLTPSADMKTLRVSASYTFRGLFWGGLLQAAGVPLVINAAVEMVHE